MRSPVYRNLDTPFHLFGFSTFELTVLCFALVGGGEFAQAIAVSRVWPFVFTIILALTLFWIRRSLGGLFGRRFVRFLRLPNETNSKILTLGKTH